MQKYYKRTFTACMSGLFVQAIITNLTAVLFVPMMSLYGFGYSQLGILIGVNFLSQLCADISFSGVIDRVGYKKMVLPTCVITFAGLVFFAASPIMFKNNIFIGVLISTVLFSFSGGLLEILMSPMVNACTEGTSGKLMSLLHAAYAWGQIAMIIITTLFIYFVGKEYWQYIVLFWSLVPAASLFLFIGARFPATKPVSKEFHDDKKSIVKNAFFIFALLSISFGGAAEVTMNEWASTFAENGLNISKTSGDLVGMCGFALFLGLGRLLYGIIGERKMKLHNILILTCAAAFFCYIVTALCPIPGVSVVFCALTGLGCSIMWPGSLIVNANHFPNAGAWLFAFMAVAGDSGCSAGPFVIGRLIDRLLDSEIAQSLSGIYGGTQQAAIRMGLLAASVFPLVTLICHIVLKKLDEKHLQKEKINHEQQDTAG